MMHFFAPLKNAQLLSPPNSKAMRRAIAGKSADEIRAMGKGAEGWRKI